MSDITHFRTNADGKVIAFTEEQMQLVHVWMTAARSEGATEDGESYSRADVERVCDETLGEVLEALKDLCNDFPPAVGKALMSEIVGDLQERGIIQCREAE